MRGTRFLCHRESQSRAAGDGHELGLGWWGGVLSLWALTRGGWGRTLVGEAGGTAPCLPGRARRVSHPEAPDSVTGRW